MRSSYDSYSSTSNSLRNSNYSSPSHSLDIGLTSITGSDRAEFHDRYQNKVTFVFFDINSFRNIFFNSMHGSKKIMLMKLVRHIIH